MPALWLHPARAGWKPGDARALPAVLRDLGLIGAPLPDRPGFLAGPAFLDHILFLGCSPEVALAPDPDRPDAPFCHLTLCLHDRPRLVAAARRPPPRCPACRAAVPDPEALSDTVTCADCGWRGGPEALDWRRAAGLAASLVAVQSVYPHEAVPSEALLAALAGLSGCEWRWFYA